MKYIQLIVAIGIAFLLFSTPAMAHTELSSTNPSNGEVLTEPITEIGLTYSGQIEQGSVFELRLTTGEEVAVEEFSIMDGVLTGTLAAPLENGDYEVVWNSISEDGHPLNGQFGFTVDVPVVEEPVEEEVTEEESEETVVVEDEPAEDVLSNSQTQAENTTSPMIWIIAIAALLLVGVSIYSLTRRKSR